jgi:hypothetical protein
MPPGEPWLATLWPLIRARLPPPPARAVDIGCGPLGGFVPMLRAEGYDAIGIDPQAPEQPHYRRIEFERAELPPQVDAVVASTSLHHVADPAVRAKPPLDLVDRSSAGRSGRRSRVRAPSLPPFTPPLVWLRRLRSMSVIASDLVG